MYGRYACFSITPSTINVALESTPTESGMPHYIKFTYKGNMVVVGVQSFLLLRRSIPHKEDGREDKIQTIKQFREMYSDPKYTVLGLYEAKSIVDYMFLHFGREAGTSY